MTIYMGSDFVPLVNDDQSRFCYVYGTIVIVDDPRRAHFRVFVEETEGLADLIIFKEEIRLYADRQGIWHFGENPGLADYVIYLEDNKFLADFSIFYTDIESFARCQ
jgi:hypothetical protein